MRILNKLFILGIILSLGSCSTTQYVSDSLGHVDTTKYKTYSLEENCADDINPIMQIRIKNAVELRLKAYNYSKDNSGDILVKYFVKNMTKKYQEECSDEYSRWEGGKVCFERVVEYEEGSLVIDIIDARTNSIIWHGAAYGPSWSRISNPNEKVNEVVFKLVDRYFNN